MGYDAHAALAAEAFVYGFPLVFDLQEVDRFRAPGHGERSGDAVQRFGHARSWPGPKTRSSRSTTTPSTRSPSRPRAAAGRLDVPDTRGPLLRAAVRRRLDEQLRLRRAPRHRHRGRLVPARPPGWDGEAPSDAHGDPLSDRGGDDRRAAGRSTASDDLPAVAALQADLTLTPTGSRRRGLPTTAPGGAPRTSRFFEQLRVWMQAFPPARARSRYQQRFEPLGLFEADSPVRRTPIPSWPRPCAQGVARARQRSRRRSEQPEPEQNGWNLTYHVFDYNLDFFEVGAIDDAAGRWPTDPTRYLLRAAQHAADCGATTATRPPTRWSTTTPTDTSSTGCAATSCASTRPRRSGVLVSDDVRHARLLPGRQPDRALLDRRPHPGPAHRRRRLADDRHAARRARRARASGPTGCRRPRATSARSCACTSPTTPSSTEATNSRRSQSSARALPRRRRRGSSRRRRCPR